MDEHNDYNKGELYGLINTVEQQASLSMPRTLHNHSTTAKYLSRDAEMSERQMLYDDAFVRGMVDVLVGRSLGAEYDNTAPYSISLKNDKIPKKIREEINQELEKVRDLTAKVIKPLCKDGEFLGSGFAKRVLVEGVGIENIIYDYTTKPQFVTPIKSSKTAKVVLFEVVIESRNRGKWKHGNSRAYIVPDEVGYLNAPYNGVMNIQAENYAQIENMNVWNSDETFYEDFIYGGCIEGSIEHYKKYKWALESLFNARINAGTIHRFITHHLNYLSIEERDELKKSLTKQIKASGDAIKQKVKTLDPQASINTMYIPVVGDNNTGSVDIQDADNNYNLTIEDALLHIKNFIGSIGFPLALTVYGDNERGGGEQDGQDENSLMLDSHSDRIRDGVTDFLIDMAEVHIRYKYGGKIEIDKNFIEVEFLSVANKAKAIQEHNRLQAIDNNTQVAALFEQWKGLNLPDTKNTREYMHNMIKDILIVGTKNEMIVDLVEYFFTKEKKVEEEV